MLKNLILLIPILLLFGCGTDSTDTDSFLCVSGNEEIIGCWISGCGQLVDGNQNQINLWGTQTISFRNNGEIQLLHSAYDNSECTGTPTRTDSDYGETGTSISYSIGNQVTDSNGVEAKEINIVFAMSDRTLSGDSLYHTTTDQMLCTSENLTIDHESFGYSQALSKDIDVTNCLSRAE